jgi:hypothetical protein
MDKHKALRIKVTGFCRGLIAGVEAKRDIEKRKQEALSKAIAQIKDKP